MKFGLWGRQLRQVQDILAKYPAIAEAVLFGSRAMGNYKEASDVDIAIKGHVNASVAAQLKAELEDETSLPFFFDIVAYSYIDNPKLKEHIDDLGVVIYPTEWKEYELREVAEKFAMGPFGSNIKANNFVMSGVPVIRGTNLNYEKFVGGNFVFLTEKKADELSSSNCFPGDLVFTHRGTLGQVGLIPERPFSRYVVSQSGMKLTVKKEFLDNEFLFYFFKSPIGMNQLLQYESQVGVPSISNPLTSLKAVNVTLPSVPRQRAIAGVLSSLDDKIDLLHRQNKTLEKMVAALWLKMLEENQDNPRVVRLGSIVSILDYKRVPLSKMEREKMKDGNLYPYYGAATVMDKVNQYIFDGEYLLLGEDGSVETEEGYPVLQLATGKFWVNNHAHVLHVNPPFSIFLLYVILRKTSISQIVTGAVQPKINQENLKALEIDVVKDSVLSEVSDTVENAWKKIKNNRSQIQKFIVLRDSLLPKLISGEVAVKV